MVSGNHGNQMCVSIDPLSLVIKCLGGEEHKLRDLEVLTIDKQPFPHSQEVSLVVSW